MSHDENWPGYDVWKEMVGQVLRRGEKRCKYVPLQFYWCCKQA